jgi:hypothetical protein
MPSRCGGKKDVSKAYWSLMKTVMAPARAPTAEVLRPVHGNPGDKVVECLTGTAAAYLPGRQESGHVMA